MGEGGRRGEGRGGKGGRGRGRGWEWREGRGGERNRISVALGDLHNPFLQGDLLYCLCLVL